MGQGRAGVSGALPDLAYRLLPSTVAGGASGPAAASCGKNAEADAAAESRGSDGLPGHSRPCLSLPTSKKHRFNSLSASGADFTGVL